MVISQTTEYALRAVVCMAHDREQPLTTQQIADITHVPASYLPKVLQPLIRCGVVATQRGAHGGYSLVADPAQLTVQRIVDCVATVPRIDEPRTTGHGQSLLDPLQQLLSEANLATQTRFANVTIADLVLDATATPLSNMTSLRSTESDE